MKDAIRNLRRGKAHLDSGERVRWLTEAPAARTVCGYDLESWEVVPWASTADEDRCKFCVSRDSSW